jgi:hypothetical protein
LTITPVTLSVTIAPSAATLAEGQSQQFSATVSCLTGGGFGCTAPQGVNWVLTPAVGTVTASGLYTASASIVNQQTVTLNACAAVNPAVCAKQPASITLLPTTVILNPAAVLLTGGQSQPFAATVSNAAANTVTWSLTPSIGSLSVNPPNALTALYTAPLPIASQQTLTLKACSTTDPAKCGSSTITLIPVVVTISPHAATLQTGQTQQFSALVTGTATTGVVWSAQAAGSNPPGSIDATGLYTAPPPPIVGPQTVTVKGCSIADPSKCDTATVSLVSTTPVGVLTPSSLTFAAQRVGTTSASQTITLTNTGASTLSVTSIVASSDFVVQGNPCTDPLPLNGSCSINVAFAPTATGARTGSLTVTNNASNSPQVASLSGTGTAPAACLAPTSLAFGNQTVGTRSGAQRITLSNCGSAPLAVIGIAVSGDFTQTNNCPSSLAAGAACGIDVTFAPTATGARSGSLTVTADDAGNPHIAGLSGTGLPPTPVATLSPTSLTFGNQIVGTTSAPQTLTLTNSGTGSLQVASIAASGDFGQTNNCPSSLGIGSSCIINVTFTPSAAGSRSGAVSVTDNAAGSPHTATLAGTGVPPLQILRPTTATPNGVAYLNPGGAEDGSPATFASGVAGGMMSGEIWGGFANPGGSRGQVLLKMSSEANCDPADGIELVYSLDGGTTYNNGYLMGFFGGPSGTRAQTDVVSLPVGQDLSRVRVLALMYSTGASSHKVFDVWIEVTP